MTAFQQHLKALIRESGPIDIERFMVLTVGHYYATRDPFGVAGDFTTAPEISQMFGEMIGVFLADSWIKLGSPAPFILCEAGPGRGTLMADILRATKHVPGFHQAANVNLIEMSPILRDKQRAALSDYQVEWHDTLDTVPSGPMLFVGNEFLDALPIKQAQFSQGQWRQRVVGLDNDDFIFGLTPGPGLSLAGKEGDIFEYAPERENFVTQLALHLRKNRGIALLIDYGHDRTATGDTLQAVKNHRFVDVLTEIGEADLTSHVDFESVARAAAPHVKVHGPAGQGAFLNALGIGLRAARLGKQADAERLTAENQMGRLFRVMALCHDSGISLAGLDPYHA